MSSEARSHARGLLCVVAAALLWSTGGLGIKSVPEPALVVAFYRSAIAAVVLVVLLRPRGWRVTPAFVVASVSYALSLTTFVMATKMTTAANAIFLQYSGVIWVLLLSPLVLGEPIRGRDLTAVGLAIGGMALFFVGRIEAGSLNGNLLAVLSGVFFAALTLALRASRGSGAEAAVVWGNLVAVAMLLPFVASDLAIPTRSAVVLGLLGVFQIGAAYALFVTGLRTVTATRASLTGMIEPVANPIWVFLLLGETPSPWALAGGAVVLAAITWHSLQAPDATLPVPPQD